jgi:NADH dehydrogenase
VVSGIAPRLVIAGGGFVGLYAALTLERLLEPGEADITLLAPENVMVYWPLLPEVASGTVEPRHAVVPLRTVLRRTQVLLGQLEGLDPGRRLACVRPAEGSLKGLPYDELVVAVGSVTKLLPVPGLAEHAVGFTTLTEAIHLRNQVLSRLEIAEAAVDADRRARALTFVFVGGGYAGVEALAELEDLASAACRYLRHVSRDQMRWVLVEATDRILPTLEERLGKEAAGLLRRRGVEIRYECEVQSVTDGRIELSNGESLAADTLVWMPGVAPHPVVTELELPCDEQGRIRVDPTLRVADGVWAAGDCAAVPDGSGGTFPPTAQHGEREGRHLGENLARVLRGQAPRPFRYQSRGEFVTLGGRSAVGTIMGRPVHGRSVWALRRAYYASRMPARERRVRLGLDWAAGLPFARDVAMLGSTEHPDRPLGESRGGGD